MYECLFCTDITNFSLQMMYVFFSRTQARYFGDRWNSASCRISRETKSYWNNVKKTSSSNLSKRIKFLSNDFCLFQCPCFYFLNKDALPEVQKFLNESQVFSCESSSYWKILWWLCCCCCFSEPSVGRSWRNRPLHIALATPQTCLRASRVASLRRRRTSVIHRMWRILQ